MNAERKIAEHSNSCRIQLRRCAVGMKGSVLQQIECGRAVHRTCDDVALLKQEVLDHHLRNEFSRLKSMRYVFLLSLSLDAGFGCEKSGKKMRCKPGAVTYWSWWVRLAMRVCMDSSLPGSPDHRRRKGPRMCLRAAPSRASSPWFKTDQGEIAAPRQWMQRGPAHHSSTAGGRFALLPSVSDETNGPTSPSVSPASASALPLVSSAGSASAASFCS